MGYINALGSTPSNLDIALLYLRKQKPSLVVAVSGSQGQHGISAGSSYLVLGPAYYQALPAAVRQAFPLGATISHPLVAGDARYVGTVGELLAAIERALKPAVTSAAPPSRGMSKAAKIGIALAALTGVVYLATRKGGSR